MIRIQNEPMNCVEPTFGVQQTVVISDTVSCLPQLGVSWIAVRLRVYSQGETPLPNEPGNTALSDGLLIRQGRLRLSGKDLFQSNFQPRRTGTAWGTR